MRKRFLSMAIVAALGGCASVTPAPRDLLNDQTGATVTVVGAPITFVRHPDARSAHNFLTVIAAQRDDDGQYTDYLLVYRWSASYEAAPVSSDPNAAILDMKVDGQSIRLKALPQLPSGLPKPEDMFVPDTAAAAFRAYATDLSTLKRIAASHQLSVTLLEEPPAEPFEVWKDGRVELQQFVNHLSAP